MLKNITITTIEAILDALPGDLTFIDETDTVKYYNKADKSDEKIFPRKPEDIGRKVQDCHRQENVPEVNCVLNELKSGKRSVIESWTESRGRKIFQSYPVVRDKTGNYLGTLVFTKDMTELLEISTKHEGKK
jgi:DUF438 domain-containing protein